MTNYSNLRRSTGHRSCFAYIASVLFFTLSALSLSAHPGHDLGAYGASHVLTSPYHLGILSVAGVLCWWGGRFIRHRVGRRFVQIGGAAMAGCAAVIWLVGL